MESPKRLILSLILILCSLESTCFASLPNTKLLPESKSPVAKAAENFLFTYFNVPAALKTLHRDVQHMISAYLIEHYLVPFVLVEPLVQYSAERSKFDTSVQLLEFSSDDSHLAIISNNHCRIGALTLDGSARSLPLSTFESQLPLDEWTMVRLNSDFTKMIILRDKDEAVLSELDLAHYAATGNERLIGSIKKLLKDDNLYGVESSINICGENCRSARNRVARLKQGFSMVAAILYEPSDSLVIATTYKQIFVLAKDGSVRKIDDQLHPFNPNKIINHADLVTIPAKEFHAGLNPSSPVVAFHSLHDVTVANYETGEYKNLLEQNTLEPLFEALSPNGQWLALKAKGIVLIIDTKTGNRRTIPQARPIQRIQFILDGKFLLTHEVAGKKTQIYHTPSLSLVGYINHRFDMEPALAEKNSHGVFRSQTSRSGKYLAVFLELPQQNPDPLHALRIWQIDPICDQLQDLYQGHITVEQALFLIFLNKLSREKKLLESIAREQKITREALVSYLQEVLNSFKIDQKALRLYIRHTIMRIPRPRNL